MKLCDFCLEKVDDDEMTVHNGEDMCVHCKAEEEEQESVDAYWNEEELKHLAEGE